ncbi:efflux RND transporter periplasmic adaptor subunit, partial [Candidatus Riflebacteria bacterium]
IDDDEYRHQLIEAQAELDVARAKVEESASLLEMARRNFKRMKGMWKKNMIAATDMDKVEFEFKTQEASLKVAKAQLAQKKAAVDVAKVRLSYTNIHTSWADGNGIRLVGEKFVHEGSMLQANTRILSIVEVGKLLAVIHVIERDYPKMRIGQSASISVDAFPKSNFIGKIVRIAPVLRENTRQARVEIEVDNEKGILAAGMFTRVNIEFARHLKATVVPQSAMVKRQGRAGLFLVAIDKKNKSNFASFLPVEIGIQNSGLVEILKPSLPQQVITLGNHMLVNNTAIVLKNQTGKGETNEGDILRQKPQHNAVGSSTVEKR